MSLFADDAQCTITDTELDVEVDDGVLVERRSILWLSASAVVAALTGGMLRGQDKQGAKTGQSTAQKKQGKLTFEQFLREVYPLARRVVETKGKDEQAYLMTVAAAMSRLGDPGPQLRKTMRAFVAEHREGKARFPLSAVSMRLRPGRGFSHHDHRNYNGVIMGLEGELRIRNFDIVGKDPQPPEGKTFQIRETQNSLVLPGRFSTLGLRRDNIHELVAGKDGARVLDVFTFFGKGARSHYLDVEKEPRDAEHRIWEAAWKPRRRRSRRRRRG